MFQTEPIKFLQSLSTEWLTDFLVFVSQLGYSSFYIPVLILITFGINFRKGFLLIQMMLWMGLLTGLLKNLFGLPRPEDVDSAVRMLEENIPNPTPFSDMGGHGFWDLPDAEAIRIIREQPDWSYGLPSGHVSGATTFWAGLSLLFRPAAIKVAALIMIVLMPLSRMYLGRHFVADVLGGLLLATGFLALVHATFIKPGTHDRLLALVRLRPGVNLRLFVLLLVLLVAPIVLAAPNSLIEPDNAGRLFGLNAAFIVVALGGLPADEATWLRRVGRVVLTFAFYLAAAWLVGSIVDATSLPEKISWVEFPAAAIPAFFALWGGVKAGLRFKLFVPDYRSIIR